MPVSYDVIQREVMLRSNSLAADDASALASSYTSATIGQTNLGNRAIEFPFVAINDCIANAMQEMAKLIGMDKTNPYRSFLGAVTSNLATGALIPNVSSGSKPRVGVIGSVRDTTTGKECLFAEKQDVLDIADLASLKQTAHYYFTDNVRIWHTRTNVVADVVIFSTTDENAAMVANPRGTCPFPDDLIPCLLVGSLSFVGRSSFNAEQAVEYHNRWLQMMQTLGFNYLETVKMRPETDK